jgi:hypothetical protein
MEADGARTSKRRRRTNSLDLGSLEPKPQILYPNKERAERVPSSPQTEGFRRDEGYSDPPRSKTSTVRRVPLPPSPTSEGMQRSPSVPSRATRHLPPLTTRKIALEPEIKPKKPNPFILLKQKHWPLLVILGMVSALLLWFVGRAVLNWGTERYNDFRYGNPRTFQTDVVVGHGEDSPAHPSHFIAMNLNNQAVVIELKAGDPAKIVSYKVPITIVDGAQSPVTVGFKDGNGDQKLDMIIDVHLSGQDQLSFFINEDDKFRPATGDEIDKFRQ